MAELELDEKIGRIGCEDAEKDDQDYAGDDAHDSERRGQRKHAIADNLSNHQCRDELP